MVFLIKSVFLKPFCSLVILLSDNVIPFRLPCKEEADEIAKCYKLIFKGFLKVGEAYMCAICYDIRRGNPTGQKMPRLTVIIQWAIYFFQGN